MNQTLHRFSPLKEKKEPPSAEHRLLDEIHEVRQRLRAAENVFANVSDPDLVEACIFELNALETRYRYLLRQARQAQVSATEDIVG